jgi:uncharacterized membrane protein YdbT with pleckstrin-like domain
VGFPRKLLAGHERIVFELRPHWVALLAPALWALLLLAALIAAWWVSSAAGDPVLIRAAATVIAVVAVFAICLGPFLRWRFTLFVLTTDRLITRSGIIAKHSKEIPLERINDVAFSQSVLERALGAGDLLIESAGERGQTRISNVRNPEQVQLMIYKESEANNNRMARGGLTGDRTESSIPLQIEALARLKEQGVLSEAEFEDKKRELLDRM